MAFALIVALLVAWLAWRATRPGETAEGAECVRLYSQAHSAHDSTVVDATYPTLVDPKQTQGLRCGVLRKAGQLRDQHASSR